MRLLAVLAGLLLSGCVFSPRLGDGDIACGPNGLCPPGFSCGSDARCHLGRPDGQGPLPDGAVVQDGGRPGPGDASIGDAGQRGDGATPHDGGSPPDARPPDAGHDAGAKPDAAAPRDAGCSPRDCASQGMRCGSIDDGCGHILNCGTCDWPNTCGGTGVVGQCGCQPKPCGVAMNCGTRPDACGGVVTCGATACPLRPNGKQRVCIANVCTVARTCTPIRCAEVGKDCGYISDGCAHAIYCGSCAAGKHCMENVCR